MKAIHLKQDTSTAAATNGQLQGTAQACNLNILLAEDDAEMRRLLYDELRAKGHAVSSTCDGTEVLEALSGVSKVQVVAPDVIIMDVRMPGYSGLHVLAALRAAHWSTPVILITAFGDRRVHEEGARLGANIVLDKPFDIDVLLTALRDLSATRSEERRVGKECW